MIVYEDFDDYLEGLTDALRQLPQACQLAYALSCCERHFKEYLDFHNEENWGNPTWLREAIDTGWKLASGGNVYPLRETLLADCMSVIPDSDEFSTPLAGYAQDAAIMIVHIVEFIIKNDVKYLVMIAVLARDLIDAKVQLLESLNPLDVDIEAKIASHPLMKAEFWSQKEALRTSGEIKDLSDLELFRKSALRGS